eukprot:TRINITY_DN20597_c0_g1_i1.p1 TRINITY_DN20597_c0_g1~~TRINITY_DN20597_c0_g1_i1.p1  ORF type:complete len:431 (+),score=116.54 TRINITY_DN20597_c0_g1_i1:88-1293(+)
MGCCHAGNSSNELEEERAPIRKYHDDKGVADSDVTEERRRAAVEQIQNRRAEEQQEEERRKAIERMKARMGSRVEEVEKDFEVERDQLNTTTGKNGTKPERYEKISKLGKGAFGTVWKARDLHTKAFVAIKIISKESLALDEHGKERLSREVTIMKSLSHKNLVNLYGLITNDKEKEMWMIVEFVDGKDLMNKLQSGRLPEKLARNYFQQLLVGINYVHSQHIAHRDLKPDNILVTSKDLIKITDFGLSNFQAADDRGAVPSGFSLKTCCGTPYYVAPEVITSSNKKGYSGFTCDIWSLGILLYVMVIGDVPFSGSDLKGLLQNITKGIFSFPSYPAVTPQVKSCIRSILVMPDKRVSLQQLAADPWVAEGFDVSRMDVKNLNVESEDPDLMCTIKAMEDW